LGEAPLKEREKRANIEGVGKWIAVGSELPIMVLAGAYIGYYLGEQNPSIASVSIILGALLGFILGVYNIYKIIQVWERRYRVQGGAKWEGASLKGDWQGKNRERGRGSPEEILKLLRLQQGENGVFNAFRERE